MLTPVFMVVPGVRHQQKHNALHQPYGLPTLLTALNPILTGDMAGVIKHKLSGFKTQTVFLAVALIFGFVP